MEHRVIAEKTISFSLRVNAESAADAEAIFHTVAMRMYRTLPTNKIHYLDPHDGHEKVCKILMRADPTIV